jgi:class 3 adenylate cyclase
VGPRTVATTISPLQTVTFLCTDIEESTRLWEEQPEAMRTALAWHDAILGQAVEGHGGAIFKRTGDGALATLRDVPGAVGAATDALRALSSHEWGDTGPLAVRVGIHTGSAEERDGDFFGPALNRTSRLMAAAHGGQVVLSSASAALVREELPGGLELVDLGLHRLRGLSEPERVFQLTIEGLRSQFPPLQSIDAFPASLHSGGVSFASADDDFAGRGDELERLELTWQRAARGVRQVALVGGDPGMGKTRLTGELAKRVYDNGAAVLYGRCDEDAIVPYQPFVEALRPVVAATPTAALRERLHGLEQDLTRLFPELLRRLASEAPAVVSDPEAERYRLFEAVTGLVTGVAAGRPALLVLDDVHWADKPTLLLFRHVVRSAPDAALLVVACYRTGEVTADQELTHVVADLRRETFTEHVGLQGLSESEAGDLLRSLVGREVPRALTGTLHRETGGSPFFLTELLRSLMETNAALLSASEGGATVNLAELELPESVRDVVGRRVRRLPPGVSETLGLASVVGAEFDVPLLARAGDRSTEETLEALDCAKEAGLVVERPGRLGSYSFAHALIRQTLYTGLGSGGRAHLHHRVGAALEERPGRERRAAALAQHFSQALALGSAPKAIDYTAQAGHEAVADLAFEDAARYFERALSLVQQHAPGDTTRRVELLIDWAGALVFVDEAAGVQAALEAVDAARAGGSADQFGRAVAVVVEPVSAIFSYRDQVAPLFDEAKAALGDDNPSLKARLLAFEAFKYSAYQLQGRDGGALAVEAVALAREAGEPLTLAEALHARAISLEGTTATAERQALGEELVGLGREVGGRAATATAYGLRVLAGVQLELGQADALALTVDELGRVGDELHWLPALVYAAQWRATKAIIEGRFEDVRACWADMRRYARAYRAAGAMEGQQRFYLTREERGLSGIVGTLEEVAAESSGNLMIPAMLALALLDAGDDADARATLDSVVNVELRRNATESAWGSTLGMLGEVAASVGTPAQSALLHDLLQPLSGRLLATVIGLASVGAADRYLGMLSTRLEHWDDAEAEFDQALALETRARAAAFLPRTQYWRARFLQARGGAGDESAARDILGAVAHDAERLGMQQLRQQAEQLGG